MKLDAHDGVKELMVLDTFAVGTDSISDSESPLSTESKDGMGGFFCDLAAAVVVGLS